MEIPSIITQITGQKKVPFGRFIFTSQDKVRFATIICQEIWSRPDMFSFLLESQLDIIFAGNGSCYQFKKVRKRKKLISNMTNKRGAVCYTNMKGLSGGRIVLDGGSLIGLQGKIIDHLDYLTPYDMDYRISDIDFSLMSPVLTQSESSHVFLFEKENVNMKFLQKKSELLSTKINSYEVFTFVENFLTKEIKSKPIPFSLNHTSIFIKSNQEIMVYAKECINWSVNLKRISEERNNFKAISAYLLEYLFKTRAGGYFIALSGGSDSSLNAAIIYFMCQSLIYHSYSKCNLEIISKISYILESSITLRKVELTESEKKTEFYLTDKDISEGPETYCLANVFMNPEKNTFYQYFIDEKPLNCNNISKILLNVAYLPMKFSGSTKIFFDQITETFGCTNLSFPIQNVFDSFHKDMSEVLQK